MRSFAEIAGELYDALETRKSNEGKKFVCLKDGSPEWMTEVIRKAHGESWPDDTIYAFIEKCAGAIHDAGAETEDAATDAVYEIDPDIYTSQLTAWLHARADHVFYLSEVLEEWPDIKDGFQLLQIAQSKQIQEVGSTLVSALVEMQENSEEEENETDE